MNTVINFKTDRRVKTQAQRIAGEMGLNLSDVLNVYLRRFVKRRELHINLNEDESIPSRELLMSIKEAREERGGGKMKRFQDIDTLSSYLAEI